MHNLEGENYVIFSGLSKDSRASQLEGLLLRGKGGTKIHECLQQRPGSGNFQRLMLTKETQISQVNKFSTFLCIGRCKSLDSVKSLLRDAPELHRRSVLLFSILSPLWVHTGTGCSAEGLAAGSPFVSSLVPQGSLFR